MAWWDYDTRKMNNPERQQRILERAEEIRGLEAAEPAAPRWQPPAFADAQRPSAPAVPDFVQGGPFAAPPSILPREVAEQETPLWGIDRPPLGMQIKTTEPWQPPEWMPDWLEPAARSLRYHVVGGVERVKAAWERPEERSFLPSGTYTEEEEGRDYPIPTYAQDLSDEQIRQLAAQHGNQLVPRMLDSPSGRQTVESLWPSLWMEADPRIGWRRWEDLTRGPEGTAEEQAQGVQEEATRQSWYDKLGWKKPPLPFQLLEDIKGEPITQTAERVAAVGIQAGLDEPQKLAQFGIGAPAMARRQKAMGLDLTPEQIGALSQRTASMAYRDLKSVIQGEPSALEAFMRTIARGDKTAEEMAHEQTAIGAELLMAFTIDPLNHFDLLADVLKWGPRAKAAKRLTRVEQLVAREAADNPQIVAMLDEYRKIIEAGGMEEAKALRLAAEKAGVEEAPAFWKKLEDVLKYPADLTPGALMDRDVSEIWVVGGGPIAEMESAEEAVSWFRQMAADPDSLAYRYGRTVTSEAGQKASIVFSDIGEGVLQFPSIRFAAEEGFDPLRFILDVEAAAMGVLKSRHGFKDPEGYMLFANAWKALMSEFYLTAFFSPGYALARNPATDLFTMTIDGLLTFEHVDQMEAYMKALSGPIQTRRVTTKGVGAKTALTGLREGESMLPGPLGWLSKKGQEIARHGEAFGRMPFGEEPRYRRAFYKGLKDFVNENILRRTPPVPAEVTMLLGPEADDLLQGVAHTPGMKAKRQFVEQFLNNQAPGDRIAWQKYLTPRDLDSLSPELSKIITDELSKLPKEATEAERRVIFDRLVDMVDEDQARRMKDIEQLPGRQVSSDVDEAEVTEPFKKALDEMADSSGDPELSRQRDEQRQKIDTDEQEIAIARGEMLEAAKREQSTGALEIMYAANRDVEDLRNASREALWELLTELRKTPPGERGPLWVEYFAKASGAWDEFAKARIERYGGAQTQLSQLERGMPIDEILPGARWDRALDRLIRASDVPPPPEGMGPGLQYAPGKFTGDPVESAKFNQFIEHQRGSLDAAQSNAWREAILSEPEHYSEMLDFLDSASRRVELYGKITAAEMMDLRAEMLKTVDRLYKQGKFPQIQMVMAKYYGKRNDLWRQFFQKGIKEWNMAERDVMMLQLGERLAQPTKRRRPPRDRQVPYEEYMESTGQTPARKATPTERGERADDALPGDDELVLSAAKKEPKDWTVEESAAFNRWVGDAETQFTPGDVAQRPLPEEPPGNFTRGDWRRHLTETMGQSDEVADGHLEIMDARANQYAKHFNTTPDEWWTRWIAGGGRAEEEAALLQFQRAAEIEEPVISHFGVTDNFNDAGYILRDGRFLNFQRSSIAKPFGLGAAGKAQDHAWIWKALPDEWKALHPSKRVDRFMEETGAIRVSHWQTPGSVGLETMHMPSTQQRRVIMDVIEDPALEVVMDMMGPPDAQWGMASEAIMGKADLGRYLNRIRERRPGAFLGQSPYKGGVEFLEDGRAWFYAFDGGDVSTVVHEPAHVYLHEIATYAGEGDALYQTELKTLADWLNWDDPGDFARLQSIFAEHRSLKAMDSLSPEQALLLEATAADAMRYEAGHEAFARGFERYMAEGIAPTPELQSVFEKFKNWLLEIYHAISNSDIDIAITDEVRGVFDRLLAEQPIRRTKFPSRKAGKQVQGWTDPLKPYDFEYVIADMDDLIASHSQTLQPNDDFPIALQPRSRDRAGYAVQVQKYAENLSPTELLSLTPALDAGPLIVGADGVIESGNGRFLSIERARLNYPENYAAYTEALGQRLADFGLTADELSAVDHPVLVRKRLTDVDRAAFALEGQEGAAYKMSAAEVAASDVDRVSDEMLASLTVGESETVDQAIRRASNRNIVNSFLGAMSDADANQLRDPAGKLGQAGVLRLKSAMLAKTYPGEAGHRLLIALTETTGDVARNIEAAIFSSLGEMARMEGAVRSGKREAELALAEDVAIALEGLVSLGDDVAAAVDMLTLLKSRGESISDYLQQQQLFARELTPLQEELLKFLGENTRTPVPLRELLKNYAKQVMGQQSPDQTAFAGFGEVRASKEELLDAALRNVDPEQAGRFGGQAALFQRAPSPLLQEAQQYLRPGSLEDTSAGFLMADGTVYETGEGIEHWSALEMIPRLKTHDDPIRSFMAETGGMPFRKWQAVPEGFPPGMSIRLANAPSATQRRFIAKHVQGGYKVNVSQWVPFSTHEFRYYELTNSVDANRYYQSAGALYQRSEGYDWLETARGHYGLTEDTREAGFVTPTGRMLSFAGEYRGARSVTHETVTGVTGAQSIEDFLTMTGAARVSDAGNVIFVELRSMPSPGQMKWMNEQVKGGKDLLLYVFDGLGKELYRGFVRSPVDLRMVRNVIEPQAGMEVVARPEGPEVEIGRQRTRNVQRALFQKRKGKGPRFVDAGPTPDVPKRLTALVDEVGTEAWARGDTLLEDKEWIQDVAARHGVSPGLIELAVDDVTLGSQGRHAMRRGLELVLGRGMREEAGAAQVAAVQARPAPEIGPQMEMFDPLATTPLGSGTRQTAQLPGFEPQAPEAKQMAMPGMEVTPDDIRTADRAKRLKPRVVDFQGQRVRLTGETETLHGGTFWSGTYESGPKMGQSVDVADEIVQRQTRGGKAGQGTLFQEEPRPPEAPLVALHNLTEENLIHADDLGGIAVPSVGVTGHDIEYNNYGPVTLIGNRRMIDPEVSGLNKVFDSDAYSPTWPRLQWKKPPAAVYNRILDRFKGAAQASEDWGNFDTFLKFLSDNPDKNYALNRLQNDAWAMMQFATERGEDVGAFRKFKDIGPVTGFEFVEHPDIMAWMAAHEEELESAFMDGGPVLKSVLDELAKVINENASQADIIFVRDGRYRAYQGGERDARVERLPLHAFDSIYKSYSALSQKATKFDRNETYQALFRYVDADPLNLYPPEPGINPPTRGEYQKWAQGVVAELFDNPMVRVRGKLERYTLSNIVDAITTKPARASEEMMTFGAGAARAYGAEQLRTVEKMHEAAPRLKARAYVQDHVTNVQKPILERFQRVIVQYHQPGRQYGPNELGGTWEALDDSMRALGKYLKRRKTRSVRAMREVLQENHFFGGPDGVIELALDAADVLRGTPTQYFEAKLWRAVDLSEFSGAVVHEGASQRTLDVLQRHGLEVRTYPERDAAARSKAVEEFYDYPGVLFQEEQGRQARNVAAADDGATEGPAGQLATEAAAKATKRTIRKVQSGVRRDWEAWQPQAASDELKTAVYDWLDKEVEPAWWEFLAVAKQNAKVRADDALFNYRHRRNFDMWMSMVFPYHFWFTRSGYNWAQRLAGRPALLAHYIRVRDALRLANENAGRRQRFESKIDLPAPWLPDWMGDSLYVDPFRMVLPYANIGGQDWDDSDEKRRGLRGVWAGIQKAGLRPYHYLEIPYKAGWLAKAGELIGMEPEKAQEVLAPEAPDMSFFLPQTNLLRGVTAGAEWAPPGGINIEAPVRRALGLPAGEVWDPYRTARMLGNMAAEDPTNQQMAIASLDAQELIKRDKDQTGRVWSPESPLAQEAAQELNWTPERLAAAQELLSEATTRAAKERLVSGVGWLTGPTLAVEPTGERAQLEMAEAAKGTIWRPGQLEGSQEQYQAFKKEYPAMYPRGTQYQVMPGESTDAMTPGVRSNWLLYTQERDSINEGYNQSMDGFLRQRPWDLAGAFGQYYDQRKGDLDAAKAMYPMPELTGDVPELRYGMNPGEMWDAVVEDQLYDWQATEPQADSFTDTSGEIDWDQYNRAEQEWRTRLPELRDVYAGTYAGMDAQAAYDTFKQRFHTPIQAMAYTYRDQIKNPTWERYRLLVAQGVSKGDAYAQTVEQVGPLAATVLIPGILQQYEGMEWTPEELSRELQGINFPALGDQRKGGEVAGGGGGYAADSAEWPGRNYRMRGSWRRSRGGGGGGGGGGRWKPRTTQYPRWRPPRTIRGGPFRF